MPNVRVRGIQGSGKTSFMVLLANRLVNLAGYSWDEVYSNFHIRNIPGCEASHYMKSGQIREFIKKVYNIERGQWTHIIILLDEIDGVYTHADWSSKTIQSEILGMYQDEKFHNWFVYTKHWGKGVNKLIRDVTEVSIKTRINKLEDKLIASVIDGRYEHKSVIEFYPFSWVFNKYSREEPTL